MSSRIEVGSIKMKIYNWVFTLTFSRSLNKMARIIVLRQWQTARDYGHAPARATFLTESTRLSLSFPLLGIPSSDSPSPTFSYSHVVSFSFSLFFFFFFSCLSSGPLYSSIFFSFRSLNSFQPESSISLRYPHHLYIILIHDLYLPNDFSIDS